MKKLMFKAIMAASLFLNVSCSYNTATVYYKNYNMYTSANAGNIKYEEIMPIQEEANGFVWESCDQIASRVASGLYSKAKAVGGNALVNVHWFTKKHGVSSMPTCKTAYGWFLFMGVGGLAPWVKSAAAEATVVKMDEFDLKKVNKNHKNVQDQGGIP